MEKVLYLLGLFLGGDTIVVSSFLLLLPLCVGVLCLVLVLLCST